MGSSDHGLEHPKKRRRREVEVRPLAARLVFDESVKGNAAILSQGLWSRLSIAEGNYVSFRSISRSMLTPDSFYRYCLTGGPDFPSHYPLVAPTRRYIRVHMDPPHCAAAAVAYLDRSTPAT